MKKTLILIAIMALGMTTAAAQKKYEKIVYKETSAEGEGFTIVAKDGISTREMTKFKVKISNKTDDIILYRANESTLKVGTREFKPNEKVLAVPPAETESKVVNFNGLDFMVNSYTYAMDGFYKVSTTVNALKTDNFQLPASYNEFKTGNFTCNMIDMDKETDKTVVKFECRYMGDKIGVIHPGRAAVKLPDGTEVANGKANTHPIIVEKGESKKFTMVWNRMSGGRTSDMQKIKMEIVWRNTFVESEEVKLKPVTLDFQIDEIKSR